MSNTIDLGLMDWDDTALIAAYDSAVRSYVDDHSPSQKKKPLKRKRSSTQERKKEAAAKKHKKTISEPEAPTLPQVSRSDHNTTPTDQANWNAQQYQQYSYPTFDYMHHNTVHSAPNTSMPFPNDKELAKLLLAWYNVGYSTGYYQATQDQQNSNSK